MVLATSQPNVLAVQASNPANTVAEFVAWAKAQGSKLSYGSVGNGSSSHLTMELFKSVAGIEAVHVPYAGSPPAATSLAAGDTQALFTVAPALLPLIQGGRVKLIAATSLQRTEAMPELPTFAESGYPGFEALAWNGLFAPAGTPAATVERINADVNAVLRDPAVRETLRKQGLVPGGGTQRRVQGLHRAGEPDLGRDHPKERHHHRLSDARRRSRRHALPSRRVRTHAVSTRLPMSRPPRRRLTAAAAEACRVCARHCDCHDIGPLRNEAAARRDHAFIQRPPMTVDATSCRTPYRPNRCRRRSTPAPISRRRGAATCITACTSAAGA